MCTSSLAELVHISQPKTTLRFSQGSTIGKYPILKTLKKILRVLLCQRLAFDIGLYQVNTVGIFGDSKMHQTILLYASCVSGSWQDVHQRQRTQPPSPLDVGIDTELGKFQIPRSPSLPIHYQ